MATSHEMSCNHHAAIYYRLCGTIKYDVAHFPNVVGAVTVAMVVNHISLRWRPPRGGGIWLFRTEHDHSGYIDDHELLSSRSKVVVRMTSSCNRPPPLRAVAYPVRHVPENVPDIPDTRHIPAPNDDGYGDALTMLAQAVQLDRDRMAMAGIAAGEVSSAAIATSAIKSSRKRDREAGPVNPYRICNRCAGPWHPLAHCPANDDPNMEVRRVRHSAGIPTCMLRPSSDGNLVLHDGTIGNLMPQHGAFAAATACYRPLS